MWRWLGARARIAIEHGVPSLAVTFLPIPEPWALPVRTLLYTAGSFTIAYLATAQLFALTEKVRVIDVLVRNVGFATIRSMFVLGIGGGILYALLQHPVGYFMAPGLLGFLFTVRSNVASAQ